MKRFLTYAAVLISSGFISVDFDPDLDPLCFLWSYLEELLLPIDGMRPFKESRCSNLL